MKLEELFSYKNQLMQDILTDEELVKLISYGDDTIKEPKDLAYTHVYPYEYLPDTLEEGQTFVMFDVDILQNWSINYSESGLLYKPVIYVWVMCHKSLLRLPEGGVRIDAICAKICDDLDGSWFYGLGKLNLYSAKRFATVSDYMGKVLTFNAKDIKRGNPNTKEIPKNRRDGI